MENALTNDKHPQYIGIDLLRFFAAVMVMLFHLVYLSSARQGTVYWISSGLVKLPQAWPYTHWGWVGVQVFFVISGFVIALTAQQATVRSYIVSRVTRLGPGVWICAPFTFLLATFVLNEQRGGEGFIHSMLFLPYGPWVEAVYWTLGIEIAFYAVVLVLIACRCMHLLRKTAFVIGGISTAFWLMYTLAGLIPLSPFFTLMHKLASARLLELLLVHHGCQIAIGILLWHGLNPQAHSVSRPELEDRKANRVAISLFALATVVQIHAHNAEENAKVVQAFTSVAPILAWLAAMAFLALSIHAAPRLMHLPPAISRFSRRLGLMTYPLYLVHLSLGAYVMGCLARAGWVPATAALGGIACSIALSWAISVFLEPPLQKLIRTWLSQRDYRITA